MPTPRFEITDRVKHFSGATGQVVDILEPDSRVGGYRYLVARGPGDHGQVWYERAMQPDEDPTPMTLRRNGSPEENFIADLRSRLDIGDRFVNMRVPYPGSVHLQFYNVPTTHQGRSHGADQENNRIMLTFSGLNGPKAKVEATVLGPSFGGPDWRLRAKSGTPDKIAEYAAEFLNRAAQKKPYGFTFDNYDKNSSGPKFSKGDRVTDLVGAMTGTVAYGATTNGPFDKSPYGYLVIEDSDTKYQERRWLESDLRPLTDGRPARRPERDSAGRKVEYNKNARSEPDETAARELSLFIENDYALVGAPNSRGKAIEKNLLAKIRNGTFSLPLSEKAWMYLMEDGAKKYSKEFSDGRDWSTMFNKATRELVAHEFATTFYDEHKATHSRNASDFEVEEFDAPAHWASAFINGDTSGLEEDDLADFEAWNAKHPELGNNVVDASEETHFGRFNGLQHDLCTYTAHVRR